MEETVNKAWTDGRTVRAGARLCCARAGTEEMDMTARDLVWEAHRRRPPFGSSLKPEARVGAAVLFGSPRNELAESGS